MAKVRIGLCFIVSQTILLFHDAADAQGFSYPGPTDRECETPDDEPGVCIGIKQCPALVALLRTPPLSQETINFLRRSQCGSPSDMQNPKVCCASNNGTNDDDIDANSTGIVNSALRNNSLLPAECWDLGQNDSAQFDGASVGLRIAGGKATDPGEFPWFVILDYGTGRRMTRCVGSLINERYVLTAAHCVTAIEKSCYRCSLRAVRLGEYDTSINRNCYLQNDGSRVCDDDTLTIEIEEIIVHESYTTSNNDYRNDIALIRLSNRVNYTDNIRPICLPERDNVPRNLWIAGWGKTENSTNSNVKLKVKISSSDQAKCFRQYERSGMTLGPGQLCAGGRRNKDTCAGDSGGPLMSPKFISQDTEIWTVIGIVSFGVGTSTGNCGVYEGRPGIYTKVANYVPWILSKIRP